MGQISIVIMKKIYFILSIYLLFLFLGNDLTAQNQAKNNRRTAAAVASKDTTIIPAKQLPKSTGIRIGCILDSDGDGIEDQYDREQTPEGCPVDPHGVSLDTDGDGIPDCKDHELITPTYCQPVDSNGIGYCPLPTCCQPASQGIIDPACVEKLGKLPSVVFNNNSATLSTQGKKSLDSVAYQLYNMPGCFLVVSTNCFPNERNQQLSWNRVNAVINYLVDKKGVGANRILTSYASKDTNCNAIELRGNYAGEEQLDNNPPPHPNLRRQ